MILCRHITSNLSASRNTTMACVCVSVHVGNNNIEVNGALKCTFDCRPRQIGWKSFRVYVLVPVCYFESISDTGTIECVEGFVHIVDCLRGRHDAMKKEKVN